MCAIRAMHVYLDHDRCKFETQGKYHKIDD